VTLAHRHDDLVRLNVAAVRLGLAAKTVKKYCHCGKLHCRKLPSGQWRVYRASLEALVGELETGPNRPK
jgi:predicted site-specific integrase-resolvase